MNNNISIENLLKGIQNCSCKRDHNVSIEDVIIEDNAIDKLESLLNKYGYKNLFLVYDNNTYKVCNEKINKALENKGFNINSMVYVRDHELTPDERSLAELMVNFNPGNEFIIAVGSGVINDICKYASYKLNKPYMVIATAPSMDGYASNVSALTLNNLKVTYPANLPKAIVADIEILKNAPYRMILAGFGDIMGKFSALKDWRLGQIVNNEYVCEEVYDLVNYSINNVLKEAENIKNRNTSGIKSLMDSLVLTGIGMAFVGNSRPASGSEHHLSHYIEIQSLLGNFDIPSHGEKVACGTVLTQRLRERLVNTNKELEESKEYKFSLDEWKKDILSKYKEASNEIFSLCEKNDTLSESKRLERVNSIHKNKQKIVELLSSGPSSKEIIDIYDSIGLDYDYSFISHEMLQDAVLYAKEIRDRYTISHLLWDLRLLDEYSKVIPNEYYKEKALSK
ncbi:sn-glycerol-1-phosphate dehydrogenase [Romboutsia sp. Marseille-P6047]|uniref:sn-glycerol-1-phosphate dehydrogenase n=1 Tax=Romboutsia sp. Marseille-P6047 TaxID=2161817 RepID=UPI000F0506BD|nr:sn-glycerol-1-phosphate dehydrogenase [Romboutsia sp. Marseille-P6047]